MDLGVLIDGLAVPRGGASPVGVRIVDLTEDSRTVLPGSMFVAREGGSADGRRFIANAIRDGAAAILTDAHGAADHTHAAVPVLVAEDLPATVAWLAERFFGEPSKRLRLVGVTGTNGKSTVAHLTHGLLNSGGIRAGLIGTIEIDDGREVARSEMTTLPAIELSRTLATMVEHGCRAAVMEVSSHALDQRRVRALAFDAAIFTMLGSDHLDYHGTLDAYAGAKARLFQMLAPEALAIVNAEDPACGRMLRDCRARVLRCGVRTGEATVHIENESPEGMTMRVRAPFGACELSAPLLGSHNAMNALQAVCAAVEVGLEPDAIAGAAGSWRPPPGRLERVSPPDGTSGPVVFVDYAHTADALERTLSAVRAVAGDRPIAVVFGCGGDRDAGKRPVMGATAARLADRVVLTSDNPRREEPGSIISMVLEGIPSDRRDSVAVHADRARAIESAILQAADNEIVVIAGKGHEREQIVPDGAGGVVRRPFDDVAEARCAIARRGSERPVQA